MRDVRILPIEADCFYHIYNRSVNGETIFKTPENYINFLNKVKSYLLPVCDIYCYALLPNHFHFLVKIKSAEVLKNFVVESGKKHLVKPSNLNMHEEKKNTQNAMGLHSPQHIFSKQFSRIFNSYSQAFNKQNGRHGPLIIMDRI